MIKQLKYLIALFLAFGLMVNDGTLESQSNQVEYYQFSNPIVSSQWKTYRSKLYDFNQATAVKTVISIPFTYLQFAAIYSLQIKVLVKLRVKLYQKASSFIMQHLFISEMMTSTNSLNRLYIA
ncbi:hypothetical protein HJ01_01388 [Flavobacterium frigoris PS1]|uniref:Uncharacterized protein n=1 Tax=Flavobacterium frigoris (strain PS1) TaxID=1086011 RepID=H7FQC8_FLAFP|nr:hypothetical protein HJ01_01388 [Flavobacterium frigoris PS1]